MVNELAVAVEPFRSIDELEPADYAAMGAAVVRIAYESRYVPKHYGLQRGRKGEPRRVAWSRRETDFVLEELVEGSEFALQTIRHGFPPEIRPYGHNTPEASPNSYSMYVFGDSDRLKFGLARVVHLITDGEPSAADFLANGKAIGAITKDDSRFKQVDPKAVFVTGFRRAFFSILEDKPVPSRFI